MAIQIANIHAFDNVSTKLNIELKKTIAFAFAKFVRTPFIKNFLLE